MSETGVRQRKDDLRQQLLQERRALSPAEINQRSRSVVANLGGIDKYAGADCLLLYHSFDNEVATDGVLRRVLQQGRRVVLPRVNRADHALQLYHVEDPETDIAPGTWDIPEPVPGRCERADIGKLDCVVVPGVAFDECGGRLGYGGGYYDRLLSRLTEKQLSSTIGLCYDFQLVEDLPIEPFDVRMAFVCAEAGVIEAERQTS